MSSNLSGYLGNKFCRWLNNQAAMPSSPSALYIALFNGNPKSGGTEVGSTVNGSNPRQVVTFAALASGVLHTLTSDVAVDWGNSAGTAPLSHIGLFDASSSGNLLASKPVFGGPFVVHTGQPVKFLLGAITFNIGADT